MAFQGVVARILEEMRRQDMGYVALAARLRRINAGWTDAYTALRLGELLPCAPERPGLGGRYPLTVREIIEISTALRVPVSRVVGPHHLALVS